MQAGPNCGDKGVSGPGDRRRRRLATALALILLIAGFARPGTAADTVFLRLSHWVPPSHPLQKSIEAWAKSIEKASGGTIRASIFPSEQLGKAFDHYDMVRDGIADAAYINPGYQPGRFPVIAVAQLPMLFADAKGGTAALDEWYRRYAKREMADVRFCLAFIQDPGTFHSNKKVVVPEDVDGLKVRPSHSTMALWVTRLGGATVQASAPGARDLLERGVADAITFPWGSLMLFGIEETVTYHLDFPLYTSAFVWVLNKSTYAGMSADQKRVIDDHCTTDWALKFAGPWAKFEAAGRDEIKAMPDHEVYEPSEAQVAAWRDTVAPLHDAWAKNAQAAGIDPQAALAALRALIAENNAGYSQTR